MAKYQPRHAAKTTTRPVSTRLMAGGAMSAAIVAPTMFTADASAATSRSDVSVLQSIKACESGGDYTAQNPTSTASGAYQFLDTTWRGLSSGRGYARAKFAPKTVQDAAAIELFNQAGTSPWLASKPCWGAKAGAPTVTDRNTTGTTTKATTTVSRTAARSAVPSTVLAGTPAFRPNPNALGKLDPPLRNAWATDPFSGVTLSARDKAAIANIEAKQATQSWWTWEARHGRTVTRHVSTAGSGAASISTLTHTAPTYLSASTSSVRTGTNVTGHYVNIDWFKITRGAHAGEYVNTSVLHRLNAPASGTFSTSQLTTVPSYLRANQQGRSAYLNFTAAKQLIRMNAAYRAQFGTDLTINEGYRTLATQQAYYKSLGSDVAAVPGQSNHGYGLGVDFANQAFASGTPGSAWINTYGSVFGFNRPAIYDNARGWENWHVNFVG